MDSQFNTYSSGVGVMLWPGRLLSEIVNLVKPYLLIMPAMLILAGVIIYPLIFSLSKSLTDFNLGMPGEVFIGLKNYITALNDQAFRESLGFSVLFSLCSTGLGLALGFGAALLLQRDFIGKRLLTILIILPMMVTPVAVGIIWLLMFQPDFSIINGLLGLIGINGPIWLQNKWSARIAVIVADVWQWTPFFTLILLGGLLSLPAAVIESAKVDGASGFQLLRYIKVPMMKSLILVVLLIRLIDSFKTFDSIFIMTNGGPGSATEVLSLHIYRNGLPFMNISYASAMSYLFLIILIVTTTLLIRQLRRAENV